MIPIAVSARHIHLTKEHIEVLFGIDYKLTKFKNLMGGQFAAEECVKIKCDQYEFPKVRVLGPPREKTQLEISKTDAVTLHIDAPYRYSGDLKGAASFEVIGPKGAVQVEEGCIIALRHIHMNEEDAMQFHVKDKQMVSLVCDSDHRNGVFNNVLVRVDPTYELEIHIDTDEANGLNIKTGDCGYLIP